MNSEYGKKSAAEMRAAQREKISQAETAVPAVVVTEKNWIALIESQKAQVKTLGEILEKFDTLTTKDNLVDYMNQQLQILHQDGQASAQAMEQYRQTLTLEVKTTTLQLKDLTRELEKQVGKTSEEFGKVVFQEQERMKRTSKMLFWISMIPSLILLVLEVMPLIWPLIFPR